ncbi:MAG: radical SAM protein [Rhodospirillales bacterium]|nr:MAG: radical SAM protein [Rhodospirillales bacterium]
MDVLSGLDAAKEAGVAIRVSIIVTKVNAHEVSDMEHMIRARGIDYHTFWQLSPTLKGNSFPLDYEADIKRVPVFFHGNKGCSGGKTTLHVYASGRASPCRLLPHISIDLLSEEFSNLTRLELHPGTRPTRPECAECPSIEYCTTCAPVLALHKNARKMSRRICRW